MAMGYTHRDNAQFSRAKWRKRLLLPCWIVQIGLLLGMMGLFSWRLSRTVKTWKDQEDHGQIPMVEFVWEVVNVSFSFVSLVITFVSIARFIAEVLTPLPLLFGNVVNLALSSAILALDVVVYAQYADRQYSTAGLAMDVILMFFTLIPTFYSVVIYRRLLTYDDYHIPGNVKPYDYASAEEPEETAYRSSWLEAPAAPYDPTNPSAPAARPRSLSAASRRISLTFAHTVSPQPQPSPPPPPEAPSRHASYDHRRDTQFDEYVRRRSSAGRYSQEDLARALGAEFGWGEDGSGNNNARDSVVGTGSVAVAQARPRGDSLSSRQASLEASISISRSGSGSTTTTASTVTLEPPAMARAHSLNSVPEAHEEEGDVGMERRRPEGEDRQALLGGGEGVSRSSSGSSRRSVRRIEPVEGLEDVELEHRKRRRES
ncbi:hypothetical protein F4818DRAFT_204676 [Hypoxylon cercidicola]|nr:hypothetical protein F4818DRAFT_204676 [Hypoxylon cercidicola]